MGVEMKDADGLPVGPQGEKPKPKVVIEGGEKAPDRDVPQGVVLGGEESIERAKVALRKMRCAYAVQLAAGMVENQSPVQDSEIVNRAIKMADEIMKRTLHSG